MCVRTIFLTLIWLTCFKAYAQKLEIEINPSVGMTFSNLNFSIAGDLEGNNPNILSELDWNKLNGFQIGSEFNIRYNKRYLLGIFYSKSFLYKGTVTDRDFASDNRQNMYTDLFLSGNRGYLQNLKLSLGYTVLQLNRFSTSIGLQYSNLAQKYYLLNFKNSAEIESSKLNSYYQTNWNNYGIYLVGNYNLNKRVDLSLKGAVEYVDYNAKASWNLIDDFAQPISFIHNANGYAYQVNAETKYNISRRTSLKFAYALQFNKVTNGVDELFLKEQISVKTRLNAVRSVVSTPLMGIIFKLN